MSRPLRRWLATTVVVFAVAVPPSVRADWVAPDSITPPPAVSPATDGSPVASGGWVTDQYKGQGLVFSMRGNGVDTGTGTAVVLVNGSDVWAAATYADAEFISSVSFGSRAGVAADLVHPGTDAPTFADLLQVKIASAGYGKVFLTATDKNGNQVVDSAAITPDPNGVTLTVSGAGLTSFNVYGVPDFVPLVQVVGGPGPVPPAFVWGVAGVEFESAPEPAGLALAGLGMAGLIGYAWKRRPSPGVRLPAVGG